MRSLRSSAAFKIASSKFGRPHFSKWCLAFALIGTGGCARPMTQSGPVSQLDVKNEQLKQQELVVQSQWKLQERLESVAFPLLQAAVPLCGEHVGARSGIRFTSALMYDKEYREAARMAGLSDTLSIVGVTKGSAAERAGMQVGDRILEFAGGVIEPKDNATKKISELVGDSFSAQLTKGTTSVGPWSPAYTIPNTALPITLRRDTTTMKLVVPMDTVCAFNVVAAKSDDVNAFADGKTVYVTSAMLRFVTDDDELATVVAHEIGHNAMRHMDAKRKNALVAGLFGAVLDIASAAGGVNTGGKYTNEMMAAGAMTFSQDFEREADYVGMYILARAHKDYKDAPNIWRHIATENPKSIKFASSHPTTAERFVRLGQTSQELDRKIAGNEPLFPELKVHKK
jgi:beta-barrel assembly-enhancing protease